jgi:hypothetical protein
VYAVAEILIGHTNWMLLLYVGDKDSLKTAQVRDDFSAPRYKSSFVLKLEVVL